MEPTINGTGTSASRSSEPGGAQAAHVHWIDDIDSILNKCALSPVQNLLTQSDIAERLADLKFFIAIQIQKPHIRRH